MTIALQQAGKRFNRDWIFRNVNYSFEKDNKYALLGPNGSGKSTLLKAIAGYLRLSEGILQVESDGKQIASEDLYRHLAICAPYIDLINDLTVAEHLKFHTQFKPLIDGLSIHEAINLLGFQKHKAKLVRELSSGMRQRLKLMLTIGSASELLLLDEPATNLDEKGVQWYHQLLDQFKAGRTIVIASNRQDEYEMCQHFLQMEDYK